MTASIASMDFETRAIHEGQEPDPATGAVTVPIYQTSTYAQEAVGEHKGYDYSRTANPTRRALEICLASLESAEYGFGFSSGMGATTTIMHLVAPGDRDRRRQRRLRRDVPALRQGLRAEGLRLRVRVGTTRSPTAIDERTRLVWLETPTNPLLNIVDIAAVAEAAHAAGAVVVVDNTFATPYLQRPLELGADIVHHSTTKYLGGHSDVVGGFAATNDPTIAERLAFLQNSLGAVPGPFDSWLVLRGLKTLALRMERHCENAQAVAEFLQDKVEQVLYPGLAGHPGHELAARQMSGFGGMVSFIASSPEEANAIAGGTKIWKLAESLGGVESLIEVPSAMTHASTADSSFAAPPTLVRLSVGIESVNDLVTDLEAALLRAPARA